MTFTKEQLIAAAHARIEYLGMMLTGEPEPLKERALAIELQLACMALAGMEAEPVIIVGDDGGDALAYRRLIQSFKPGTKLYTAQQPLTTSERAELENYRNAQQVVTVELTREEYKRRFMEEDNFDDTFRGGWSACRAAMQSGAVKDGWVMVPAEPTAEMISSGVAAHYDRNKIQIHDRPAPGPIECAYVAMIAAAPQQEA